MMDEINERKKKILHKKWEKTVYNPIQTSIKKQVTVNRFNLSHAD
jgi:hypothetical protein